MKKYIVESVKAIPAKIVWHSGYTSTRNGVEAHLTVAADDYGAAIRYMDANYDGTIYRAFDSELTHSYLPCHACRTHEARRAYSFKIQANSI